MFFTKLLINGGFEWVFQLKLQFVIGLDMDFRYTQLRFNQIHDFGLQFFALVLLCSFKNSETVFLLNNTQYRQADTDEYVSHGQQL